MRQELKTEEFRERRKNHRESENLEKIRLVDDDAKSFM